MLYTQYYRAQKARWTPKFLRLLYSVTFVHTWCDSTRPIFTDCPVIVYGMQAKKIEDVIENFVTHYQISNNFI